MKTEAPAGDVGSAFDAASALRGALRRLTLLGAALILLMAGFRLAFVVRYAHPEVWRDFSWALPKAFAAGLLHDQRIVLLFLLPPLLALLWMRAADRARWERWLRFAFWWTLIGIVMLITILISDFVFYAFFSTHFSVLAWGLLEDDMRAVTAGAWKSQPILLYSALIAAAAWVLVRILRRTWSAARVLRPHAAPPGALGAESRLNAQVALHVAATVLLLSWSFSPSTRELDGELPSSGFLRSVPPNGVEKLAEAVWMRLSEEPLSVAQRFGYAGRRSEALRDFAGAASDGMPEAPTLDLLPAQAMQPRPVVEHPPHVVLVVMESFATHLLRWQDAGFDLLGPLEAHWDEGWVFRRFLPSDNGSAGSILSLMVDLPYRPGTKQLSQAEYHSQAFPTSAALAFARRGYETRFLYGGPLEWRRIGEFAARQGFEEVSGQREILGELGMNRETGAGEWGVWDEHLFTIAARRLAAAARPQFLVLFTTTNHTPYELPAQAHLPELAPPPELEQRARPLSELQLRQLRTYQYACHAFGRFLDGLDAEGLLERTVVAATGDHTVGMGIPFSAREVVLQRAVPFFLLAPPAIARQFQPDLSTPGAHKDVIPTLLQVSGNADGSFRGIGSSLLDRTAIPFGYNPSGLYVGRDAVLVEFEDGFGPMRWQGDGVEVSPVEESAFHRALLRRCRASLALTDWIVCESEEQHP